MVRDVSLGNEHMTNMPHRRSCLVAEWIHFTLFGIIFFTHYKTESVHFGGLMNSATKVGCWLERFVYRILYAAKKCSTQLQDPTSSTR